MEPKSPPANDPDDGVPPSALQSALEGRSFAFYPPIRGIERNEWQFLRETWAESLVRNTGSGIEVWIPRRSIGEVSSVDEPLAIVGLTQEYEYRAGTVWPYRPKVIKMPPTSALGGPDRSGSGTSRSKAALPGPVKVAPVRGKTAGNSTERRVARLIGVTVVAAVIVIVLALGVFRGDGVFGRRLVLQTADQDYLALRAGDDHFTVVQRLGEPDTDRWSPQTKEVSFRVLAYDERAYYVVLFGAEQSNVTYLGTLDASWRPIHAVPVGRGVDSTALLKSLRRF
jgi:hypothetical protein